MEGGKRVYSVAFKPSNTGPALPPTQKMMRLARELWCECRRTGHIVRPFQQEVDNAAQPVTYDLIFHVHACRTKVSLEVQRITSNTGNTGTLDSTVQ